MQTHSDRGFRSLAQGEPDTIVRLIEILAPGVLPVGARVTPEQVDDPHLEPPPPALDADWVARVEPDSLLHVECQGYRSGQFPVRLFRYHLTLALRYFPRRVHTVAIWLLDPPAPQRPDVIDMGDITIRVTPIVLCRADARVLLADARTACFAPGADAGSMTSAELCAEVARILAETKAGWPQRRMAAIAAALGGRYKEMVSAMDKRNLGPVIIEELVDFGHDQGLEEGLEKGREDGRLENARASLLDVLGHRAFAVDADLRALIERERSLDQLRTWLLRATGATTVDDVFAP